MYVLVVFRQLRRTPDQLQGQRIHVHSLRINGDVSLTIYTHHQDNPHPNTTIKGVLGHREVCYYGGGSRSTRREPPGCSAETDKPKRFQQIDLQVKVGDHFDLPRPPRTQSSLNSGLSVRDVCGRVKITLLMY